ncbi:MAG TPA: PASTA domain-containing protein, partial [Actinomycetes bacterium]|nr:PASTA domain-containing protein [Actinomycetes bacterium]
MLTTDGKVKVMDFGIARASAVPSITQTAAVVGTAQYIAPEQAQGLEADARSDLYALGCCLYEMLTGQVPFTGPSPVAIAYRHVQEDATPPRALNPDVPVSLERVCLKAMAKRPEDRYQTALEMRQDLERARAGAPVAAGIPLASQRTQALGAVGPVSPEDARTTVLDRRVTVPTGRTTRYGANGHGVEAPAEEHPRRWRAMLFVLATLVLVGIVAMVVVRAVEVPPIPATTLPPITTLPPETGPTITTLEAPTTTAEAPTTTAEAPTTTAEAPTTTAEPTTTLSPFVTVPGVVGMRVARAVEVLQSVGLKVSQQEVRVNERRKVGRVIDQIPDQGQRVLRNSTVVIVVGTSNHG